MPFHDLNVAYSADHSDLSHTLSFHHELGYNVIAVGVSVTGKLPPAPPSVPASSLAIPSGLVVLTRLTLTISDTTQNHRLPSLNPHYSLLALRPTTEKSLQLCCSSLECDLISLDFSQRLPFILKFKTVASALQRGVRFEICYSSGIGGGNDARRNLISGATSLIRATRGRGIIISSEAKNALGCRAPWDVINLAQVWGLSQERGKEALCEEAGKVVRLASIKRTSHRGVVDIVDGGGVNEPARSAGTNRPIKTATTTTPKPDNKDSPKQGVSTEENTVSSGSLKRKASTTSTSTPDLPQLSKPSPNEPLSKREMKRRAKKARLGGNSSTNSNDTGVGGVAKKNDFPIKHETTTTTTATVSVPPSKKLK